MYLKVSKRIKFIYLDGIKYRVCLKKGLHSQPK
jgi:hypothetical protein